MSSHSLNSTDRIRRLRFRSRQRGLKETCELLGNYACHSLDRSDEAGMDDFELILMQPDHEILSWVLELTCPPGNLAGIVDALRSAMEPGPVED